MSPIQSLCVYCGSSSRGLGQHKAAAQKLGALLAQNGIALVYGGGHVGLMGVMADAALAQGGKVIGVIPRFLVEWEVEHRGISELIEVESMHERKRIMCERADAFAVLPGGLGTLDETLEIITWRMLKLHDKPIVLLDEGGYWKPLLALFDHVVAEGYAQMPIHDLYTVVSRVEDILPALTKRLPERTKLDSQRL